MQASQSTKASDSIHSDPPVLREVPSARPRDLSSHLATPILFGPIQAARKYLERQRGGGSPIAGNGPGLGEAAAETAVESSGASRSREQSCLEASASERERQEREREQARLDQARREQDRRLERSLYEGHSIEAGLSFGEVGERGAVELATLAGKGGADLLYPYAAPGPDSPPDPDPIAVRGAIERLARESGGALDPRRAELAQASLSPSVDVGVDAAAASNRALAAAGHLPSPAFADVARQIWSQNRAAQETREDGPEQDSYRSSAAGLAAGSACDPADALSPGSQPSALAASHRTAEREGVRPEDVRPEPTSPAGPADSRSQVQESVQKLVRGRAEAPSSFAHPASHGQPSVERSFQGSLSQGSLSQGSLSQGSSSIDPPNDRELHPPSFATPSPTVRAQRTGSAPEGEALAHDACNLLSAISLYSDLLRSPGVLDERHRHYAEELRLIASRSQSLIGRLLGLNEAEAALACGESVAASGPETMTSAQTSASPNSSDPLDTSTSLAESRSPFAVPLRREVQTDDASLPYKRSAGEHGGAASDALSGPSGGGVDDSGSLAATSPVVDVVSRLSSADGPVPQDQILKPLPQDQTIRRDWIEENRTQLMQASAAPARNGISSVGTSIDRCQQPEIHPDGVQTKGGPADVVPAEAVPTDRPQLVAPQIRSGRLTGTRDESAATSLADLLMRWGSLLSTLAHGTLDIAIAPGGATPVPVTAEALERILVNLVTNARAATIERGAIRIGVGRSPESRGETSGAYPSRPEASHEEPHGGLSQAEGRRSGVVLTVDDSGCGMSEAQVNRLLGAATISTAGQTAGSADDGTIVTGFRDRSPRVPVGEEASGRVARPEAGEAADPPVLRRQGVGLQVVRDLVAESGGVLSIQSRPGRGTRVAICWPAAIRPGRAASSDAAAAIPDASAWAKTGILEDDSSANPRPGLQTVFSTVPQPITQTESQNAQQIFRPTVSHDVSPAAAQAALRAGEAGTHAGTLAEPLAIGPDGFTEEQLRTMMLRLHRADPQDAGQRRGAVERRSAEESTLDRLGPLPSPIGRSPAAHRAATEGLATHQRETGTRAEIGSAANGAIAC